MRIKWNIKGFEAIRRLPGVEAELQSEVDRVKRATGDTGYVGGVEAGKTRSRGYVVTASREARDDNSRNHTLLRALGGGRG